MARASYTDKQIVEKIRLGEANSVLKSVYEKHEQEIIRWIKKNNGSRQEAQDIFQDSILSFYQYVIEGKYDERYTIGAFLFRVSKNKWINRVKQIQRNLHIETFIEQELEIKEIENVKKNEIVMKVLSQIGERCREVLTYSILYDLSMEDISVRMGFNSTNTAKTKNYKCKKKLEKYLSENPQLKKKLTLE